MFDRRERHQSTATLTDGRKLSGYFYQSGTELWEPKFQPLRIQPDGTRWVHADSIRDLSKLPAHINVYSDDMMVMASVTFTPPTPQLRPAFAKLLLGTLYMGYGAEVIKLEGFNYLRQCLRGEIPDEVCFTWLGSDDITTRYPNLKPTDHTFWGGYISGGGFLGGVSLRNSVVAQIVIRPFDHYIPTMWFPLPLNQ